MQSDQKSWSLKNLTNQNAQSMSLVSLTRRLFSSYVILLWWRCLKCQNIKIVSEEVNIDYKHGFCFVVDQPHPALPYLFFSFYYYTPGCFLRVSLEPAPLRVCQVSCCFFCCPDSPALIRVSAEPGCPFLHFCPTPPRRTRRETENFERRGTSSHWFDLMKILSKRLFSQRIHATLYYPTWPLYHLVWSKLIPSRFLGSPCISIYFHPSWLIHDVMSAHDSMSQYTSGVTPPVVTCYTCRPHAHTHSHTQKTLWVILPFSSSWQTINNPKKYALMSETLSVCSTTSVHLHMMKFVSVHLHTFTQRMCGFLSLWLPSFVPRVFKRARCFWRIFTLLQLWQKPTRTPSVGFWYLTHRDRFGTPKKNGQKPSVYLYPVSEEFFRNARTSSSSSRELVRRVHATHVEFTRFAGPRFDSGRKLRTQIHMDLR